MKKQVIKVKVRPIWEIGKGHNAHLSGAGTMDNRPKRLRTRSDQKRKALNDGW